MSVAEELKADPQSGFELSVLVSADLDRCVSCNACRLDCPMSNATDLLHPLKLLRMLSMGLIEEVIRLPEIWYCLQCNQCSLSCPMTVKPATLIRYLRREALRRQAISLGKIERYEALCSNLQRVRYRFITDASSGADLAEVARLRDDGISNPDNPVENSQPCSMLSVGRAELRLQLDELAGYGIALEACMTCNECATACPVAYEHLIYDPVAIFRMVNYGLIEELLRSPSIWLCLECQACTEACAQNVSGHLVFRSLQELAILRGLVSPDMRMRLKQFDRIAYPLLLADIDDLSADQKEIPTQLP